MILGTIGIWHLDIMGQSSIAFIILVSLLILPPILIVNKKLTGKCIWFFYNKFILKKVKNKLKKKFEDFYDETSELISYKLLLAAILTFAGSIIFFTQCYLLVISMGIPINFMTITVFMSISRLISLIPITISGIGTRDAILIYLFSLISLNSETAISYSLLVLFSFFIFNGLIGAFAWWIKPLNFSWDA